MLTAKLGTMIAAGAAMVSVMATPVMAAPGRIHWSGDVDDRAEIHIQGNRVWVTRANKDGVRNERVDVRQGLPMRREFVTLVEREGRGRVRLVQQPRPNNNFTAIVRINDPDAGRGHYDFTLRW